jgi:uncharacterized protein (DUF1501 family)
MRLSTRAAGASAMLATLGGFQRVLAATPDSSGYKALVCVWLSGGNQAFNWVVPSSSGGYSVYSNSRASLALPRNTLLTLNGTASDGYAYGMHPSCPELQSLFNAGHAAVICNVGTLVEPTTAAQARAGNANLPLQLFSHIDQTTEWMTSQPDSQERVGWAGRIADYYAAQNYRANLAMNINIGGVNYWQDGRTTGPYVLGQEGVPKALDDTDNTSYRSGARARAAQALLSQAGSDSNVLVQQYAAIQSSAADKLGQVASALNSAGDLSTPFPSVPGDWNLSAQLHQVARCIKAQSLIGDSRQIFFVQLGGFDTHDGELAAQQSQLAILSQNLNTFWTALGELGMRNNVTVFTGSDFGRTIGSNADGSDHGWGSHHLVFGGAVKGGKYYGTMPDLALGGANDYGGGQIVPTTATDQYAATLARWFGVPDADLDSLFPNLSNFAARNLGFV